MWFSQQFWEVNIITFISLFKFILKFIFNLIFIFSSFIDLGLTDKNFVYLGCTLWFLWCIAWFNMHIQYEMIIPIKLINTSITQSPFMWWEHSRSILSKFQAYTTVLLTKITMMYIRPPELIHLRTKVCAIWPTFPIPPPAGNHCSPFWFYEFSFFWFHI